MTWNFVRSIWKQRIKLLRSITAVPILGKFFLFLCFVCLKQVELSFSSYVALSTA